MTSGDHHIEAEGHDGNGKEWTKEADGGRFTLKALTKTGANDLPNCNQQGQRPGAGVVL